MKLLCHNTLNSWYNPQCDKATLWIVEVKKSYLPLSPTFLRILVQVLVSTWYQNLTIILCLGPEHKMIVRQFWTWQNGKQSTWQNSQANNIPHIYTRGESTHKPEKLNGIKWETIESSPPEPINHYDSPIKGSDVHLFSPFGNHVQICRFKTSNSVSQYVEAGLHS